MSLAFLEGGLDKGESFGVKQQNCRPCKWECSVWMPKFTTQISLHQFSHKFNCIDCPCFYPHRLISIYSCLPTREAKFSEENPKTETPPQDIQLASGDQGSLWLSDVQPVARSPLVSRLQPWHCSHGSCLHLSLVQKRRVKNLFTCLLVLNPAACPVSDYCVLPMEVGIQPPWWLVQKSPSMSRGLEAEAM